MTAIFPVLQEAVAQGRPRPTPDDVTAARSDIAPFLRDLTREQPVDG